MFPTGGRARRNSMKITSGKGLVLNRLENVAGRCNDLMDKTLPVPDDLDFMDCNAEVYEGSDDSVASGSYTAYNSTHAEMNALAVYIAQETDFTTISTIEITAPPCKSCAFVLELLGVIDSVVTTKGIYKHATGSWTWPAALRDPLTFDFNKWQTVKGYFAGSGLTDQEILNEVINVVQRRSALQFVLKKEVGTFAENAQDRLHLQAMPSVDVKTAKADTLFCRAQICNFGKNAVS